MVRGRDGPLSRDDLMVHAFQMQLLHDIPHVLNMRCDELDGFVSLYFVHEGKRMLSQVLRSNRLRHDDLLRLLNSWQRVLQMSDSYLLHEEQFLFDPDYVFVEPSNGHYFFIHLPLQMKQRQRSGEQWLAFCQKLRPYVADETRAMLNALGDVGLRAPFQWSQVFETAETLDVRDERSEPVSVVKPLVRPTQWTNVIRSVTACGVLGAFGVWWWTGDTFLLFVSSGFCLAFAISFIVRSNEAVIAEQVSLPLAENVEPLPLPAIEDDYYHRTVVLSNRPPALRKIQPYLINPDSGERIELSHWPFVIGRDEQVANFVLSEPSVSRLQVECTCDEGRYFVRDLGSRNGTLLNDQLLIPYKVHPFMVGDVLAVGRAQFILQEVDEL